MKANTLPQVSWIVAPANQSEHASNHPAAGEDLTARLLKVMQENPDVYAKTAFILNYDEGGQFFVRHCVWFYFCVFFLVFKKITEFFLLLLFFKKRSICFFGFVCFILEPPSRLVLVVLFKST